MVKRLRHFLFLFLVILSAMTALAIDNPDAPDYISEFLARANAYEEKLQQGNHSNRSYEDIYAEYEAFLNKELNLAYCRLMTNLDEDSKVALETSQRKWTDYRDSEFYFIQLNWNAVDFGSSSTISRGDYRIALVKHRVISLLHYLRNYANFDEKTVENLKISDCNNK